MSKDLDVPFVAYIPYHVQICDEISDAAKLYFGQLAGLCVRCGYCWATDEQLAKMKGTSERNIQRWNKELEDNGFIYRETKNYPRRPDHGESAVEWDRKRRIFVNQAFQVEKPSSNKDLGTAKNGESLGTAKNGESLGTAKNGGVIKESSSSNSLEQQSAPEAVVVSLENLNIEHSLKLKIYKNHSSAEIEKAVERCLRWASRPSDAVGILTTLKRADTWEDNPTPEEIAEGNEKYLKSLMKYDLTELDHTRIVVTNKYIEFSCGMKTTVYAIDQTDFKKNTREMIAKLEEAEYVKKIMKSLDRK